MAKVQIFWDPAGLELDSLGTNRLLRITDGDTPFVSVSIRMLSIDTPEVHYPGNSNPTRHDDKLKELADWMQQGRAPVSAGLAAHLQPRLVTGTAGTLQKQLLDQKLTKPSGSKRPLFLRAADERFDQYGRLLAYVAPSYSAKEREALSYKERATFNLLMVESGWAASFPIYPSLPRYLDLTMLRDAAEAAFTGKKGAWADAAALTGYEFRMCYRLWEITRKLVKGDKLSSRERYAWVERYCVDMTTREIHEPRDYYKVPPYNRIFIWPKDVTEAVGKLNLLPGG
jgi:endonuclease YncB( thermonuclease family)